MDAKAIGELAGLHHATILIRTPTFCSAYIRKCEPEQFKHLRDAIVGAERLREPIAAAFKEKFGVDLLEGYGCTEMATVVAVNVPDVDHRGEHQRGTRAGSVGHPLPGVAVKIVDAATGEGPLFGQEGLLLVKGPNRMHGYLGDPERTRGGHPRRLVCHRGRRHRRRGRVRAHNRSIVALQQDRRGDGAASQD